MGGCSLFNLCVWRVALLIGMSGGGLIDCLIACSPNSERLVWVGGREGTKEDQEGMRGFNAAENGKWTWTRFGKGAERGGGGVGGFYSSLISGRFAGAE